MITNLYVIYDKAANFYNKPFAQINEQIALRSAYDLLEDPRTDVHKSPEDFTMFWLGTYDDETAQIHCHDTEHRKVVCRFHELPPRKKLDPNSPDQTTFNPEL